MLRNSRTCQGIAFNNLGKCTWKTLDKENFFLVLFQKKKSLSISSASCGPKEAMVIRQNQLTTAMNRNIPWMVAKSCTKKKGGKHPIILLGFQPSMPYHPLSGDAWRRVIRLQSAAGKKYETTMSEYPTAGKKKQ